MEQVSPALCIVSVVFQAQTTVVQRARSKMVRVPSAVGAVLEFGLQYS